MSEERCAEIRRNPNPEKQGEYNAYLENVFCWIGTKDYLLDDIVEFIMYTPEDDEANPDDFPNNIKEIFWMNEFDDRFTDGWIACGILTNGSYFLFTAWCDERDGFYDTRESYMRLWITGSWANIINHAMDEEIYQKYMDETNTCILCKTEPATMGWSEKDCCADCFWDRDAEEKRIRRADPEWQTQRAFSATNVIFNK
jgi:hypothetical protein